MDAVRLTSGLTLARANPRTNPAITPPISASCAQIRICIFCPSSRKLSSRDRAGGGILFTSGFLRPVARFRMFRGGGRL